MDASRSSSSNSLDGSLAGLTFVNCVVQPQFGHTDTSSKPAVQSTVQSTVQSAVQSIGGIPEELPLSQALTAELTARGATVVEFPTLTLKPVTGNRAVECQQQLDSARAGDWLVFTSANALRALGSFRLGVDRRSVDTGSVDTSSVDTSSIDRQDFNVAVVGERSRLVAERHGFRVKLVAEESTGESLGKSLSGELERSDDGSQIFFLHGDKVASGLERTLFPFRHRLKSLEIYRSVTATPSHEEISAVQQLLREDVRQHPLELEQMRVVYQIFTSGQSLRNYLALVDDQRGILRYIRELPSCVIGKQTAEVGREFHMNVVVVPGTASREAFMEMLELVVFHERALYSQA